VTVEDVPEQAGLLGLYDGVPLTERDGGYAGMVMPDRITLYRIPICAMCRTEAEVVDVVAPADALPLPDASFDAVLVGQAWHWFDADQAFAEVARVLRPGGVLAALWNDDAGVDWVRGMYEAARWDSAGVWSPDDEPSLPAHPAFAPDGFARFPNPTSTTVDGLIASLRTRSFALTREPAEREAIFDRIRAYLAAHPETASGEFALPLVTDVVRVVRR
jgi:SAM-dependent methyltransferase